MADYHLATLSDALEVISQIGCDRIPVIFDWHHIIAVAGPEATVAALTTRRAQIGHVQAASYPPAQNLTGA
jgi:hydroxypyruvate isomerase